MQLYSPGSVVHAALQAEAGSDVPMYEPLLKSKLAAALLSILTKTARELAGRPAPPPEDGGMALPHKAVCVPNEDGLSGGISELVGRNFSNARRFLNGRWARCSFVNDGHECYSRVDEATRRGLENNPLPAGTANLYLYFRSLEGRWAVSETITTKGPHVAATVGTRLVRVMLILILILILILTTDY